jgi:hypothetical protein
VVVVPGVNVFVGASVVVNANVNAEVNAAANTNSQAASQAGAATFVYSSGGAMSYAAPTSLGLVQGLNVEGGVRRSAYEATRTRIRKVVIQAVCVDDREVPHPASQVSPDREIEDRYEGELYRCIAGTHMQVTIADFNGHISFEHGQTLACAKGDALYHVPGGGPGGGGQVVCRPQKPARDCNERSLLRRFGAGVKILTLVTVEKYTAYREEQIQSTTSSMSLDGGVGGVMY